MRKTLRVASIILILIIIIIIPITVYIVTREEKPVEEGEAAENEAELYVNLNSELSDISPYIYGANIMPWKTEGFDTKEYRDLVKEAGIKMLNFPMGCYADSYNWRDPNWRGEFPNVTVDEMITFADEVGASIFYTVNMGGPRNCVAGRAGHHNGNLNELEELVSIYGNKIKYYKLSNEVWTSLLGYCSSNCWTKEGYKSAAIRYATAIKEAVPDAKVYLPVVQTTMTLDDPNGPWTEMINDLKEDYPNLFDGVTEQSWVYESLPNIVYWPEIAGNNIFELRYGIQNPGGKYQLDSRLTFAFDEWDTGGWQTNASNNLGHALYTAEMLRISIANNSPFSHFYSLYEQTSETNIGAPPWCIINRGPSGGQKAEVFPPYYAYKFMKNLGNRKVDFTFNSPKTDIQGTGANKYNAYLKDTSNVSIVGGLVTTNNQKSKVSIYLINRSENLNYTTNVRIDNFNPKSIAVVKTLNASLLSSADIAINDRNISGDLTNFDIELPAHSATILVLEKEADACIDRDGDGYGMNCTKGNDCNDDDPDVHENCESEYNDACLISDIHGRNGLDSKVSGWDLAMILANFKKPSGEFNLTADIYGPKSNNYEKDGKVDGYDLSKVLGCWGDV